MRKMIVAALTVLAACAQPQQAPQVAAAGRTDIHATIDETFVLVADGRSFTAADGGQATAAVYIETLARSGNPRRFWVVFNYDRPQPPSGARSALSLFEVNCADRTGRAITRRGFRGVALQGGLLGIDNTPEPARAMAPGTMGDAVLQFVCTG